MPSSSYVTGSNTLGLINTTIYCGVSSAIVGSFNLTPVTMAIEAEAKIDLSLEDIVWPENLIPDEQEFYLQTKTVVFENPYNRRQQVLDRGCDRWVSRMTFERVEEISRELDGFLAKCRGPISTILVPDFRSRLPRGSASTGVSTITGQDYDTNQILIQSSLTNEVGFLMPGDMVQGIVGSDYKAFIVTDRCDTDGSGVARASVQPRIRSNLTTGPLILVDVRVRMRLQSDDSMKNPTRSPRTGSYSVELYEVL